MGDILSLVKVYRILVVLQRLGEWDIMHEAASGLFKGSNQTWTLPVNLQGKKSRLRLHLLP